MPRPFQIKLENCDLTVDANDPSKNNNKVSLTFTGSASEADSALLGITGTAKGAGIALTDGNGKNITLGTATDARLLQNGSNTLSFSAYLQGSGASGAQIVPGEFQSVADFTGLPVIRSPNEIRMIISMRGSPHAICKNPLFHGKNNEASDKNFRGVLPIVVTIFLCFASYCCFTRRGRVNMQGPLMMPLVRLLRQAVNKLSIWMLFPSLILLEMGRGKTFLSVLN